VGLRLSAARVFLPPFLKRRYLGKLFLLTAEAYGVAMPDLEGTSDEARLRLFASFTCENALKTLAGGDAESAGGRLFRNALAFGEELRRSLGVRTFADAMAAARVLYRAIGIDFEGAPDGTIVIRSCRFAAAYTPEICGFVSSLDRGILAGLAGGGRLRFVRRLTEGNDSCLAEFRRGDGRG
jgi:hypothetical protein